MLDNACVTRLTSAFVDEFGQLTVLGPSRIPRKQALYPPPDLSLIARFAERGVGTIFTESHEKLSTHMRMILRAEDSVNSMEGNIKRKGPHVEAPLIHFFCERRSCAAADTINSAAAATCF